MTLSKRELDLELRDTEELLAAEEAKSRAFEEKVAAAKPEWVTFEPEEPAFDDTPIPPVEDETEHAGPPSGLEAPPRPEAFETTCLADVRISPVDWLWEGRIARGMITLVEGDPGVGKSTLVADIVARHTTGKPFPGYTLERTPERALWLTLEDSLEHTLKPRVLAAGGDPGMIDCRLGVPILAKAGSPDPVAIASLRETVRKTGATLMVIDPGAATVEDANSEAIVRQAMGELFKMGQLQGLTTIWIRHLVKSREGRSALMAGGGSIGLAAAARSILQVVVDRARKESGNHLDRCLINPKNNLGREAEPHYFGLTDTQVIEDFMEVSVARAEWAYTAEEGLDHRDILDGINRFESKKGNGDRKRQPWEEAIYGAFETNGWELSAKQVEAILASQGKTAKTMNNLGQTGREFRKTYGIVWDSVRNVHRMERPGGSSDDE
jgi:KaiC/GvpD/RAD55 family RecA-like ATPase